MNLLKVCFVTSEIHPFSKTGGLADVAAALSRYLARSGHDVRVFSPLYSAIESEGRDFKPVPALREIPVSHGETTFTFSVVQSPLPGSELGIYFIDCPQLYHRSGRSGLYTSGRDEPVRFSMLSRAVIESCQRMAWAPDVFHCHDWHASLTPIYLKTLYAWDSLFRRSRTALTIHNIGYQGVFPADCLPQIGLAENAHLLSREDLEAGRINFLRTGILHADVLTTVSLTYAQEIQTEEFGAGLHDLLRSRAGALVGIVNGIDYDEWDPGRDPYIPALYTIRSIPNKGKNKKALVRRLGLAPAPEAPVLGIVSRLTVQKGFELLFETLPAILSRRDCRLAVLGTGEAKYEAFFERLQKDFPGKVSCHKGFSSELAHLIEAGSDMFLMPSLYEPCGLNQMYSLKYGTVPVVRKTGGLADTVQLFNPATGEGTGFVFDHFTPEGLRWALEFALDTYPDEKAWRKLIVNGMSQDFSWDVQGRHYVELYSQLAGRPVAHV